MTVPAPAHAAPVEASPRDDGFIVPQSLDGHRLVDVCWAHLGTVVRRAIGPLIAEGGVTVDGIPGRIAQPVTAGQRLRVHPAALTRLEARRLLNPPTEAPLSVVHRDDDLLIVDKPAGLHVHPMGPHRSDTLLGRVLWHLGARPGSPWTACAPSPAHRLDRPTSGLVLFTRTADVRDALQQMLERHEVIRTYEAQVHGHVEADEGRIDVPLAQDPTDRGRRIPTALADGGQTARSRWRVLDRGATSTRVELHLETGRTHQLRAHLAHLGHPILGDVTYGAEPIGPPPDPSVGSVIQLRATRLQLPHPRSGAPVAVHADDRTTG